MGVAQTDSVPPHCGADGKKGRGTDGNPYHVLFFEEGVGDVVLYGCLAA